MAYKSILIDQITACYNDKSWFIPLEEILKDLTSKEAAYKSDGKQSIWSIVNHLIFWNERWLERFETENIIMSNTINNDETFYLDPNCINEHEWKKTLIRLENIFSRWIEALEKCEESKLTKVIPDYYGAAWWGVVSNLSIHNAYHIGQIMLLKKQMKDN